MQQSPWYAHRLQSVFWDGFFEFIVVTLGFWALLSVVYAAGSGLLDARETGAGAIAGIAGAVIVIGAMTNKFRIGGSRIYLSRRQQRLTFWERNRDEIIKTVITALIGGLAGFFLGKVG